MITRLRPAGAMTPTLSMQDPALLELFTLLGTGDNGARLVGGAVRDGLLGREVTDIDLATIWPPATVIQRCTAAGLKSVPTGIDHGTVTIILPDRAVEITTLRDDLTTDGRHAVVGFTGDWQGDAARRDFTLNAFYADPDGTLYDPTGGLNDLPMRIWRFIADPAERIAEDYLRILRLFRFYAVLGGVIDPAALSASQAAAANLATLSVERIWREFAKSLAGDNALAGLMLMSETDILSTMLPEYLGSLAVLQNLLAADHRDHIDPLLRLAALIRPDQAESLAARWRFSTLERTRFGYYLSVAEALRTMQETVFGLLRRYGRRATVAGAALITARGYHLPDSAWEAIATMPILEFPLRGADLLALGENSGPGLGETLRALENWWEAHDGAPGHDDLIAEFQRRKIR